MGNMIPDNLREIMIHNAMEIDSALNVAHEPVVKLYSKYGKPIWLLSELDPKNGIAFGICDLGQGKPEYGYVSIPHLESIKHAKLRVPMIEIDQNFQGKYPLAVYMKAALTNMRITDNESDLLAAMEI